MAELWIAIDENANCGYFPLKTFELLSTPHKFPWVKIDIPGPGGLVEVVGWCSANNGSPCNVSVALVREPKHGRSLFIYGGDQGIRISPGGSEEPWSLTAASQHGAPYLLVDSNAAYQPGS